MSRLPAGSAAAKTAEEDVMALLGLDDDEDLGFSDNGSDASDNDEQTQANAAAAPVPVVAAAPAKAATPPVAAAPVVPALASKPAAAPASSAAAASKPAAAAKKKKADSGSDADDDDFLADLLSGSEDEDDDDGDLDFGDDVDTFAEHEPISEPVSKPKAATAAAPQAQVSAPEPVKPAPVTTPSPARTPVAAAGPAPAAVAAAAPAVATSAPAPAIVAAPVPVAAAAPVVPAAVAAVPAPAVPASTVPATVPAAAVAAAPPKPQSAAAPVPAVPVAKAKAVAAPKEDPFADFDDDFDLGISDDDNAEADEEDEAVENVAAASAPAPVAQPPQQQPKVAVAAVAASALTQPQHPAPAQTLPTPVAQAKVPQPTAAVAQPQTPPQVAAAAAPEDDASFAGDSEALGHSRGASFDGSVGGGGAEYGADTEAEASSQSVLVSHPAFSLPVYSASRTHCPLCTEPFDLGARVPILLHAGHSFCAACAASNLALQCAGSEVECPICGIAVVAPEDAGARAASLEALRKADAAKRILSIYDDEDASSGDAAVSAAAAIPFPVNFLLRDSLEVASVSDSSASAAPPSCVRCDESGVMRCDECESFLCAFHVLDHKRSRATASHNLQSLGDFLTAAPAAMQNRLFCAAHPTEELELFCVPCAVPICRRCTLPAVGAVHASLGPPASAHPTEDLRLASHRQLAALRAANDAVKSKYASVISAMVSLQSAAEAISRREASVAQDICRTFDALHAALEARKTSLLSQLGSLVSSKTSALNRQNQALYVQAKSLEDSSVEVDAMMQAVGISAGVGEQTAVEMAAAATDAVSRGEQPQGTLGKKRKTRKAPPLVLEEGKALSGTARLAHLYPHLLASLDTLLRFQPVPLQAEESDAFGVEGVEGVVDANAAPEEDADGDAAPATVPMDASAPGAHPLLSSLASFASLGDEVPSASLCTASGSGTTSAVAREEARFTVVARDRFKRIKRRGGDALSVSFVAKPPRAQARGRVVDQGNGKYTVRYMALQPGSYSLQVSILGKHIAGSPFSITVAPAPSASDDPAASLGREWLSGFGGRGGNPGQLQNPLGLCVGAEGLWVSDYGNGRVCLFRLTAPHTLVRCIGGGGNGTESFLKHPWGVVQDPWTRHLFVSDAGAHCINVFSAGGDWLRGWGGVGAAMGKFRHPAGMALYTPPEEDGSAAAQIEEIVPSVDGAPAPSPSSSTLAARLALRQLLFVCDRNKHRVQVFDPSSGKALRCIGANGSGAGRFLHPAAVAVYAPGGGRAARVFVADSSNHRVQVFTLSGGFISMFGTRGSQPGQMEHPQGLCVDREGNVFVTDRDNARVQVFTGQGQLIRVINGTPAGAAGARGIEKGQLLQPACVTCVTLRGDGSIAQAHEPLQRLDEQGKPIDDAAKARALLIVSDSASHRVQIFK